MTATPQKKQRKRGPKLPPPPPPPYAEMGYCEQSAFFLGGGDV